MYLILDSMVFLIFKHKFIIIVPKIRLMHVPHRHNFHLNEVHLDGNKKDNQWLHLLSAKLSKYANTSFCQRQFHTLFWCVLLHFEIKSRFRKVINNPVQLILFVEKKCNKFCLRVQCTSREDEPVESFLVSFQRRVQPIPCIPAQLLGLEFFYHPEHCIQEPISI